MTKVLPYLLAAVVVGGFVPIQAIVNSRVGSMLGTGFPQKLTATVISFTGGFIGVMLLYLIVCGGSIPKFNTRLTEIPPFLLTGGLYGIVFVTAAILLVPRIGAAATIGGFLCGQMIMSVFFDHIGFQGTPRYPATPIRLGGLGLMLLGLTLVLQKNSAGAGRAADPPVPAAMASTENVANNAESGDVDDGEPVASTADASE